MLPTAVICSIRQSCQCAYSASVQLSTTSSSSWRVTRATSSTAPPHLRQSQYATLAADDRSTKPQDDNDRRPHIWPEAKKGALHPTPYEIFNMDSTAKYSKSRYYSLVKLYHPDRTSCHDDRLPHKTRMERYRLIVAAHGILSDPVKRNAYDRFGAGWNGRAEPVDGRSRHRSEYDTSGPFSQNWTAKDDPIWQNATWEDWERFYARRDRTKNPDGSYSDQGSPMYMRNSYFVIMVSVLAVIGGSLNYNRAQDAGAYFVEQRDIVHDRAAKELRRVRQETSGLSSREERIEFFLRQREAAMGVMNGPDMESLREERAQRLLRNREVCQSEEVRADGSTAESR